MEKVNLPLQADIGIYSRLWLQYLDLPDQKNMALMVLAERIIVERSRGKKRRGKLAEIDQVIRQIRADRSLAEAYSRMVNIDLMAGRFPAYRRAGLI